MSLRLFALAASAACFSMFAHAGSLKTLPNLASPLAVVQDAKTGQVLFSKNANNAVSMASITKLMTAMVILDGPSSWLDLHVAIDTSDIDTLKHSSSRLPVGSVWTVRQLLQLALIASDNRAAHALGRVYPGDILRAMQKKAHSMGLTNTHFHDTSGLHPGNQTTPLELAHLTSFAAQYALIRDYSTRSEVVLPLNGKPTVFKNTTAIVRESTWPTLWLSKTGFTNEAGRCVAMMGKLGERAITLVLMASHSSAERTRDIQKVQHWLDGSTYKLPTESTPKKVVAKAKRKESKPKL